MKKVILLTIMIGIFVFLQLEVYAEINLDKFPKHELYQEDFGNYSQDSLSNEMKKYSNEYFSISIPSNYVQVSDFSFINENGNTIDIQINHHNYVGNPYTEENLNELIKGTYSALDSYKNDANKKIKAEYGNYLSDNEIAEYIEATKINFIDKKEISTITKSNYKCFDIITNYSIADSNHYMEQYFIVSGSNIFVISISTKNKEYLESNEIKNIINSFIIYDYEEPSFVSGIFSDNFIDDTITDIITIFILVIISSIVAYFNKKNKKLKNEKKEYNEAFDEYEENIKNK